MMSSVAAETEPGDRFHAVLQVALVWVLGSVTMGTVAAFFLAIPLPVLPPVPFGGFPETSGIRPLAGLPLPARMAVLILGAVLFAGLAAIACYTRWRSWLPENTRGRTWWTILVMVAGLAAWLFAASVTFGAMFASDLQLVLGYAGGGLPFALVAAMLQRSWRVNIAAAIVSVLLIVAGFVLVAIRGQGGANALVLYFRYISYLFGGTTGLRCPGCL